MAITRFALRLVSTDHGRNVMTGERLRSRTGLDEIDVFRLFKCAVKDDDALVDAIIEKLYCKMKEFDLERAERAIELIVDRDTEAASRFRALLDDMKPDCRRQFDVSQRRT
jgi:hypothetical protein